MSFWIITSWVLVAVLTGLNIFVFLKLKGATEQMMQMAFPGAKNMNEAMSKMQQMAQQMPQGMGRGGAVSRGGPNADAQLKAAMEMLQQIQKNAKR